MKVAVIEIQFRHGSDLEPQVRVETPRLGNHVGGQIDTDNVESDVGEHARRRAGAAADVGDNAMALHQSGEPCQHCAVERLVVEMTVKALGVHRGGAVVAVARMLQKV
jgi:hypothetical protein